MDMIKQFFLGFIKIHILYHASKEPIYGAEMAIELARHGYEISFGTLYPTLHFLEQSGLLNRYEEIVSGKKRKYYTITEKGETALKEIREKIRELMDEVIYEKRDTSSDA